MQTIVDGYLYDTDNSILLYYDPRNGRRYYMTPNARYFIVLGNGNIETCNSEFIKRILGKYDIERYREVFGEPKEG